jgi:hypothetical protein
MDSHKEERARLVIELGRLNKRLLFLFLLSLIIPGSVFAVAQRLNLGDNLTWGCGLPLVLLFGFCFWILLIAVEANGIETHMFVLGRTLDHVHDASCTQSGTIEVIEEGSHTEIESSTSWAGGSVYTIRDFERTRCSECGSTMLWKPKTGRVSEQLVK